MNRKENEMEVGRGSEGGGGERKECMGRLRIDCQ